MITDDGHFQAPPTNPRRSISRAIFDADDVETIMYDVPEWGVKLELRSPTGEERSDLQSAFVDLEATQATGAVVMRDLKQMYPALVISCAYDPETGERVFEMNAQTIAALNRKNGAVLERVAMTCMPLAGLTPEDVEEKKGGSSTSPPSASPSN